MTDATDAPDWDAIDAELEVEERERLVRGRRHGAVGTAMGRVGLTLAEIYESKPPRDAEEAIADDESGQGDDDEDPGDVVIRVDLDWPSPPSTTRSAVIRSTSPQRPEGAP